eukprot:332164-Ditylum_brightwellii.AAC.1
MSDLEEEQTTLLAPAGKVAKFLASMPIAEQKDLARKFYKFFVQTDPNLSKLNADNHALTALMCLPNSGLIKVMYGIGYGCSGVGVTKEIDGKLLALPGEGGDEFGLPQPLVLPASIVTVKDSISPQDAVFAEKEVADDTWPMFQASQIAYHTVSLLKVAPIPAFLVYDGLERDIPATTILKRALNSAEADSPVLQHCANFLHAAMKGACAKFACFFPSSPRLAVNPQETQHIPNTTHIEEPETTQPTTLKAVPEETHGMSKTELHQTLKLCGLQQGDHKSLPEWFKIITEKGQNSNTRN